MSPQIEAVEGSGRAGSVAQFGLSEYTRAENVKKAEREADMVSSLSNARSQLAGGKLNDAFQYYNRAKNNVALEDKDNNRDLGELEKSLRQSQAQRLVQRQQQFVVANAPVGQVMSTGSVQLNEEVAEQQAIKLQEAQEVTVLRAVPLRVNLPKRGIRLAFRQILQTEIEKPMTIGFRAEKEAAAAWPAKVFLGACGFAVLWWAAARMFSKRQA